MDTLNIFIGAKITEYFDHNSKLQMRLVNKFWLSLLSIAKIWERCIFAPVKRSKIAHATLREIIKQMLYYDGVPILYEVKNNIFVYKLGGYKNKYTEFEFYRHGELYYGYALDKNHELHDKLKSILKLVVFPIFITYPESNSELISTVSSYNSISRYKINGVKFVNINCIQNLDMLFGLIGRKPETYANLNFIETLAELYAMYSQQFMHNPIRSETFKFIKEKKVKNISCQICPF